MRGENRSFRTIFTSELFLVDSKGILPIYKLTTMTSKLIERTISRAFYFRDRYVFPNLYKQYVRCHLKFSVSALCSWTAVDKDRLKELRPESLENKRIYIDMLQTFKIICGFDDVKSNTWFNRVGSGEHRLTRLSDPLNLMSSRSRLELSHFF